MSRRMSYSNVARGAGMRNHRVVWKIAPCKAWGGGNAKLHTSDIPKIRKLLQTDLSIVQIAEELGVATITLRDFIKRRAICDVKSRAAHISLQRSLQKLDKRA